MARIPVTNLFFDLTRSSDLINNEDTNPTDAELPTTHNLMQEMTASERNIFKRSFQQLLEKRLRSLLIDNTENELPNLNEDNKNKNRNNGSENQKSKKHVHFAMDNDKVANNSKDGTKNSINCQSVLKNAQRKFIYPRLVPTLKETNGPITPKLITNTFDMGENVENGNECANEVVNAMEPDSVTLVVSENGILSFRGTNSERLIDVESSTCNKTVSNNKQVPASSPHLSTRVAASSSIRKRNKSFDNKKVTFSKSATSNKRLAGPKKPINNSFENESKLVNESKPTCSKRTASINRLSGPKKPINNSYENGSEFDNDNKPTCSKRATSINRIKAGLKDAINYSNKNRINTADHDNKATCSRIAGLKNSTLNCNRSYTIINNTPSSASSGYTANRLTKNLIYNFGWYGAVSNTAVTAGKCSFRVLIMERPKSILEKGLQQYCLNDLPEIDGFRIGFSLANSRVLLGETLHSFGYCESGCKALGSQYSNYAKSYGINDVVTCILDLTTKPCTISYALNALYLGVAFSFNEDKLIRKYGLVAHVVSRGLEFQIMFDEEMQECNKSGLQEDRKPTVVPTVKAHKTNKNKKPTTSKAIKKKK